MAGPGVKRKKSVVTVRTPGIPGRREWETERQGPERRRKRAGGTGSAGTASPERAPAPPVDPDLSVDLCPRDPGALVLRNPVIGAAGPFGYGVEYATLIDLEALGAISSKGTTLKPRTGNAPPRMTETAAGLLNSIGLQNPGVDAVLERYSQTWAGWQVPVLVNVAGESVEDYVAVCRRLDGVPGVAGIELNISCPNAGRGGLQFAVDPEGARAVTTAVRRVTELPLIV